MMPNIAPYEYVYSEGSIKIEKFLWFFGKNNGNQIKGLLKKDIELPGSIEKIFERYGDIIMHYGRDENTQRYKFYINLYSIPLEKSIKILFDIKTKLGIKQEYIFEQGCTSLDCLGIDISREGMDLKVYELCDDLYGDYFDDIPDIYIKEYGCLKSLSGRKKFFIRFHINIQETNFFSLNIPEKQVLFLEKKFNTKIKRRAKYLCREGQKQEIYFS